MRRPAVGITISYDPRRVGIHQLRCEYVRSVESAGALPVILAPGTPQDAAEHLDRLDALILSGGSDLDPELYGEAPHQKLGRVIRERDDFELALCLEALRRDLPLLAICRGHQLLNVACGGTLLQDLPSEWIGGRAHDLRRELWRQSHSVRVLPGSRLHAILGQETVEVNSFHHQALERIGSGLLVSALSSEDRVVEAIERPDRRFALGVQWHPEAAWGRPHSFQPLFDALVGAVRGA
ncbi:MAG TPA: gamma-glutamyl-gamma-aminobutyrate hydrolase family protein [Acidobacteriota bacterium]